MSRVATAPGKIMLAGEYAVLEGSDAVLVAVERRARAHVGKEPLQLSPFLRAVRKEIAEYAGEQSAAAQAAACLVVDSSQFYGAHGTKLGLGSSAAVTVAATACALDVQSADPPLSLIHGLAHAAHAHAQHAHGARGSGADIAAAVHGGVIAVRLSNNAHAPLVVRPLALPWAEHLVYLWTGHAAHTPTLVARVRALRVRDRAAHDRAIQALADAANAVIAALRPSARAGDLVSALEAGGRAIADLGCASGVDLETSEHRAIALLARELGGAAKPTGAGGGDVAVAAFPSVENAHAFRVEARTRGMEILDLAMSPLGVALY